jgi:hypothetical protein
MSTSKAEKLQAVHERAMRQFNTIQSAVRDERMQCLKDRRFASIPGAQWEGPLGEQFENKPRFEMNKIQLALIRIYSEYRGNRITVDFTSKDGSQDDKMADTCDDLYRADEQDSGAQEAYDNGYEESVAGGIGAWRLVADYEDHDDDEDTRQRIRLEPIFDADSCVFYDQGAKRQDKADGKHCFVLTAYQRDAYIEEFGDDPSSWPKPITQQEFDWCTPDVVHVAEYYEIEKSEELVHFFRGISLSDDEPNEIEFTAEQLEEPGKLDMLTATGFREVRKKRVKRNRVHKYILSGNSVLEDCGYIAGKCIPIVMTFGKRWVVDNVERAMGHTRLAIDAQRLKNMLISWLAEVASMSSVEKPIFTPEQMAGHTQMWSDDNVKRYPYLLVNAMVDMNGNPMPAAALGYTKAPSIPPALAALLQITEQDLQDLLGSQQAGEEMQSNISGKVVELIQNRLDMQTFIYMSNFAKAVKRSGEIWLSMAKDLYVEEGRRMKTVSSDNKTGTIELLQPRIDEKTGEQYKDNDLSGAKYDVGVDVGPSSSTRRQATVKSLMALRQITTDPETAAVLDSMIIMNTEGEGLQDLHDFFRQKLVRMGAVKPTKEEEQEMAEEQKNAQPDANAQYMQAAAKKQLADEALSQAKIGETHAKTMETLAGIESQRTADLLAMADAVTPGPIVDAPPAQSAPAMVGQQPDDPMQ